MFVLCLSKPMRVNNISVGNVCVVYQITGCLKPTIVYLHANQQYTVLMNIISVWMKCRSLHNSLAVVTRLQDGRPRNLPGRVKKLVSSSKYPYRFWGSPSVLFNGYRVPSSGIQAVKFTTHLCLMPTLRTDGVSPPLPHMAAWLAQGLFLCSVAYSE